MGHRLNKCEKTTKTRRDAIFAMVATGDFKTSKKGIVQLNTGKGGEATDAPPKSHDVEDIEDFLGVQEMSVGRTAVERAVAPAVEPNFEDNPFGFFGINFGEHGAETLAKITKAAPEGKSTSVEIAMTGVSSGGKRLTLDWWKVYLDSCASYHTFFIKAFLKNIEESGTMNGNCNAGTTNP